MNEQTNEKLEMLDICALDFEDEIFKLKLVASHISGNIADSEKLSDFILCIADKLGEIRDGYGYGLEFLLKAAKIEHIKTA